MENKDYSLYRLLNLVLTNGFKVIERVKSEVIKFSVEI